ncbi:MAG: MerR family transcriptional regulator [Isosphaeraceae bacterium]|nr:MerR family transcriptional regulator [Isosphaeraceae bacterium]
MSRSYERAEYSIAAVSKLTGVSCHALRVWERRYGYPVPHRSASGHRRYGADQVRVLLTIAQRLRAGEVIGEVMADVLSGRLEAEAEKIGPLGELLVAALVDRLIAGDLAGAEAEYQRRAAGLDPAELVGRVIEPALAEVGDRWFRGECAVFHEHAATSFLLGKLQTQLDTLRRGNVQPRRRAVLGTVQGDRHEGGCLILALLLEQAGWRALPLGVDLPVGEYQKAIDAWQPDAVGISFVLSRNIKKRFQELARLRGAPIFVGGRSILNYQGLARRHGLIPLPGPAAPAIPQLEVLATRWAAEHGVA